MDEDRALVRAGAVQGQFIKDIPAQWAKIRQGLDVFRINSKCISNGEV